MQLAFRRGGTVSDTREVRFGIREITYELSLFDSTGQVRRIEIAPAKVALDRGQLVDERHEALLDTPEGAIASLTHDAENSPAVRALSDTRTEPWLVIRVNGVRIAAKGGNWGMDDMLKRVGRERLEPFFRLHKEANLNLIRNWMGQNTEETFYDLADEYGLLVWNDFWDSTQNYNLEPDDAGLFLANARDTLMRIRNHPSIAVWCGRNEGIPSPAVNQGLARLVTELDGTRFYSASSNHFNLHDSGPYKSQEPESYFTSLALGFAVEIGLPSPPTLEAFENFLPKEDQWPISDAWAYHDWHQGGNGDTAPFMETMTEEFGAPGSLADFDRKAQMLSYEAHRAVFEGFNAHLWAPNSGRLLWMTQPAWPSTVWQIFSYDYDTAGAYFGVKKASEPIHVQMNLPDHSVAVVNNTTAPLQNLAVSVKVTDLRNTELLSLPATVVAPANAATVVLNPDLEPLLRGHPVLLVSLSVQTSSGELLSRNLYWVAANKAALRELNELPAAKVSVALQTDTGAARTSESIYRATLRNTGNSAALHLKLTLLESTGARRVLPVYYADNYVSLLPGETRTISIAAPQAATKDGVVLNLRGWNLATQMTPVSR